MFSMGNPRFSGIAKLCRAMWARMDAVNFILTEWRFNMGQPFYCSTRRASVVDTSLFASSEGGNT